VTPPPTRSLKSDSQPLGGKTDVFTPDKQSEYPTCIAGITQLERFEIGTMPCSSQTALGGSKGRRKGLHVRLDTNGRAARMYPGRDVVTELKTAGLDAVSVSLNAESEEKYNRLCKPVFEG